MNYSYADHAFRLDLISKVKGIAAAENYFSSFSPSAKNRFTYGALLNCYCKEHMEEKALDLFEKMDKLELVSNCLPFNNLMSLYMSMGKPEKISPLVQEMKRRNISLSTFTYSIWMQCYSSLNDVAEVERIFEEMKKDDQAKCSWTTYSNLAAIYVKAGLFEKAEHALKKIEEETLSRGRQSYHFLISLYAGTGNLNEVHRIWKVLRSVYPGINNMSYLVMLQSLSKLKDFEGLKKCFEEWNSNYSLYDVRLPTVLVSAYLRFDMYKEAVLIFEDAAKRTKRPFLKAREMFMIFLLTNRKVDLALSHLEAAVSEAKDEEWRPSQTTAGAFLKYFEEEKDVGSAEDFCKILKKYNCMTSIAYHLLLKIYAAANKYSPDMCQRLIEEGIQMTSEIEDLLRRVCPKG